MNHKDNTDMSAYRKIESIDIDPKKMFNDSYHVSKNTMDPFTEKIGIGVESIKIIKNFMPQNDIDIVLKFAHAMYEKKFNNELPIIPLAPIILSDTAPPNAFTKSRLVATSISMYLTSGTPIITSSSNFFVGRQ